VSTFAELLEAAGLGGYAARLEALTRPSIRLSAGSRPLEDRLGASRLGGEPDLPRDVEWPRFQGVSQSFVAQIDLAEIEPFDVDRVLPRRGLLSFFYDSEQRTWGFDPADRGSWAVTYTSNLDLLEPRPTPDDVPEEGRFAAVALTPSPETTYAPWELSEIDALGLTRDELAAYADVLGRLDEPSPFHRLLGHPEPIQGDMQLECQLVSHGLYCGDESGYDDPRAGHLQRGAADWRLLLQVDSDDDAQMMWGDAGRIYYWLARDALRAHRWDATWLILQCS
jgi:uncharacterized protein YwqG